LKFERYQSSGVRAIFGLLAIQVLRFVADPRSSVRLAYYRAASSF